MALRPGCGQGTGDWLSGRAPRSHRGGHWFDPSIAHKEKAQVTLLPRHLPAGSEQAGTALPYSSQFSGGPGSSRELAVAQTADDGPDREDPGCGANRPGWLTAAPGRHVGAVLGLVCCAAERLPELPERLTGGRGGYFGVDLHRDRDPAVPKDLHRNARMHVEGCQQRTTGLAGAVPGDPRHARPGNTALEAAVEVAGFHWRAVAGCEDQIGFDPPAAGLLTVGCLAFMTEFQCRDAQLGQRQGGLG